MKNYILSFLSLFLFSAVFAKGEEASKRIPSFYIEKRIIDSTLGENKSKFIFNFYCGGKMVNKKIRFGQNNDEKTLETDSLGRCYLKTKPGKYKLYFYYNSNYIEIITDTIKIKGNEIIEARINFFEEYKHYNVKKPVIYVYAPEETPMEIKLNVTGDLGFTYPIYKDGWNFTADENGSIKMDGKEYNYLFWESEMNEKNVQFEDKTGFLVHSDTLLNFLEGSLTQMGLNAKETADFITFWYPQMIKNKTNHIHFLFNDACDTYATLDITPKPQNLYRIGMLWANAENNYIPMQQNIPQLKREGLTVIEWGGIEFEKLFTVEN